MKVLQARCQKLEEENEELKLLIEQQKFTQAASGVGSDIQTLKEEKQRALDKLKATQSQLKQLDQIKIELAALQKLKEESSTEIKTLMSEKSDLFNELIKLKDELNALQH